MYMYINIYTYIYTYKLNISWRNFVKVEAKSLYTYI